MAKDKNKKKVNINGDEEESKVGITKSKRWSNEQKNDLDIKEKVSNLYKRKNLNVLQKPIKTKGISLLLVLVLSILIGGLGGVLGAGYILEGNDVPNWFPFETNSNYNNQNNNIDNEYDNSDEFFKDNSQGEKQDNNNDLNNIEQSLWTIYRAKNTPTTFLAEIYAPWQSIGEAVAIRKDGWLLTSANLKSDKDYVALDFDNKIIEIEEVINDPKTGISLIKVSNNNIPVSKILNYVNLDHLDNLLVLDKFKNSWLTRVSGPSARDIYKTEDLVRSTDEFKSGIRVNNGTVLERAPGGILFKDQNIVGFIKDSTIVPAWILAPKINKTISLNKFTWSYAGIEYLRVNEAPGLLSDQFKFLEKGAIVYGDPEQNSPGLEADLQNADIITKVGEREVVSGLNLTYIFQAASPGDKLNIEFTRGGNKMTTVINLGKQEF